MWNETDVTNVPVFITCVGENENSEIIQRAYELLYSMKTICQTKRPGVSTEIALYLNFTLESG